MLSYTRWKESMVRDRMDRYPDSELTRKECEYDLNESRWWTDHVLPSLEAGESLTPAICRRLVAMEVRLAWIAKHFDGQVPRVYFDTGRVIQ